MCRFLGRLFITFFDVKYRRCCLCSVRYFVIVDRPSELNCVFTQCKWFCLCCPQKQRSLQHFFVCFKERERSNCNFGSPRCECVCFLGVYQVTVYILYGQYKCVFLGLCIWRMGWMFLDHPEKHLIHKWNQLKPPCTGLSCTGMHRHPTHSPLPFSVCRSDWIGVSMWCCVQLIFQCA